MQRVALINVVGLCEDLLGPHTPNLSSFIQQGSLRHIQPPFPGVTCTAQSNYLTGSLPGEHGIVANGWYHRELAETQFWKQSNHLVQGEKIWDRMKACRPESTCAQLFWWFNMYSNVDYSITPRPMYPADGRKVFDVASFPLDIRDAVKKDLGPFPFMNFWGPASGIGSSKWIAESAKWIENRHQPTLSLIYLPHLDYSLQKVGPNGEGVAEEAGKIDHIVGDLIQFFKERQVDPIIISEYGITEVSQPVHLNRVFRENGWLSIKDALGLEILDLGASEVFAVADHQIAHVYCKRGENLNKVRAVLEKTSGVESVWDADEQRKRGLLHGRSGDFLVTSDSKSWFTYYYWLDDRLAPDFARCVDIHRKPGYDPVELFIDPKIAFPKMKIVSRLIKKKLGFRMLMDVIPLDASLVKGSHGRLPESDRFHPVFITQGAENNIDPIKSTDISDMILARMGLDADQGNLQ